MECNHTIGPCGAIGYLGIFLQTKKKMFAVARVSGRLVLSANLRVGAVSGPSAVTAMRSSGSLTGKTGEKFLEEGLCCFYALCSHPPQAHALSRHHTIHTTTPTGAVKNTWLQQTDTFENRHIGTSPKDSEQMLALIGAKVMPACVCVCSMLVLPVRQTFLVLLVVVCGVWSV